MWLFLSWLHSLGYIEIEPKWNVDVTYQDNIVVNPDRNRTKVECRCVLLAL